MIEFLGIAASLIAIASAILAIRKWLIPKRAFADESFRKAWLNLEYYYGQWIAADYPAKHKHLIESEDFKWIGIHKTRILRRSDADRRVFLFVCAVKNGVWGEWWPVDVESEKLFVALATLLDGMAGWRPVWRTAYLLQHLSFKEGLGWIERLPEKLQSDQTVQDALTVIRQRRVIAYLEEVSQARNSHLRDKAFKMLEDIKAYHGEDVQLHYPDPNAI